MGRSRGRVDRSGEALWEGAEVIGRAGPLNEGEGPVESGGWNRRDSRQGPKIRRSFWNTREEAEGSRGQDRRVGKGWRQGHRRVCPEGPWTRAQGDGLKAEKTGWALV